MLQQNKLYDALLAAGVTSTVAREAAEEAAGRSIDFGEKLVRIDNELSLHRWAFSLVIVLQITILIKIFLP